MRRLGLLVLSFPFAVVVASCGGSSFTNTSGGDAPSSEGGAAGSNAGRGGAAGKSGAGAAAGNGGHGEGGKGAAAGVNGGSAIGGAGASGAMGGSAGHGGGAEGGKGEGGAGHGGAAEAGGGHGGTTAGGVGGGAGGSANHCDGASPKFICQGTELFVCDTGIGMYTLAESCSASEKCDAEKGQCDKCQAGDVDPQMGCLDSVTQNVCKDNLTGFGKPQPCPTGAPFCQNGKCIGCTMASDCPQNVGVCQAPACVMGTCEPQNLPAMTHVDMGNDKFCFVNECDGNGKEIQVPQNEGMTDPADPGTVCAPNVCTKGQYGPTAAAAGTPDPTGPKGPCFSSQCDGTGKDEDVFVAAGTPVLDPTHPSDACKTWACTGNSEQPAYEFAMAGTPAPGGTECNPLVCDGKGGTMPAPAAAGTSCTQANGSAGLCDGMGACQPCALSADGPACADKLYCVPGQTPPHAATAVFVAATGSDANAGTALAPFATLAHAVSVLASNATKNWIYLAEGTYAGATSITTVSQPFTIEGGYTYAPGTGYTQDCQATPSATRLTHAAGDPAAVPVLKISNAGAVTLRSLAIETRSTPLSTPSLTQPDSMTALFVTSLVHPGNQVTGVLVELLAHDAGAGAAGISPPQPAKSVGTTSSCSSGPAGSNGNPGTTPAAGANAGPFSFAPDVGFVASVATPGSPGTSGQNGRAAATPPMATCADVVCSGANIMCKTNYSTSTMTAGQGLCGVGGTGGPGGGAAVSGGASIALLVNDATSVLTFIASHVESQDGGNGGEGGVGAPGGLPSLGTRGADVCCHYNWNGTCGELNNTCVTCNAGAGCSATQPMKMCCALKYDLDLGWVCGTSGPAPDAIGTSAGKGGPGGAGSNGGNGVGGPSFGYAYKLGATVTLSPSSIVKHGNGGLSGGGGIAASAADSYPYP